MLIKKLQLGVGIDFRNLDRDAAEMTRRLEAAGRTATVSPGGGGSGAAAVGLDPKAVGDELRAAILAARPLGALGLNVGEELDRVGGTLITGFRRIDSYIKFPQISAALQRTAQTLIGFGNPLLAIAEKQRRRAEATNAEMLRGVPIVRELAANAQEAVKPTRGQYDAVKLVAQGWARLQDQVQRTRAEMELAANRGPSARNRPGTGRALQLRGVDVGGSVAVGLVKATDAAVALADAVGRAAVALRPLKMVGEAAGATLLQLGLAPARGLSLLVGGFTALYRKVATLGNALGSLGDVSKRTFSQLFTSATKAATGLVSPIANTRALTAAANTASVSFLGLGRNILAAFGFVGIVYQAVGFIRDGVKAASDLNETVSAGKQVFGDAFGGIEKQASALERAYGVSKNAYIDSANAFGSIAQGAGVAEAESAKFANTFGQLAADLSSFKNITFEEAAQKLRSGLTGETEPLKAFGVVISEDAVEAKALALGLGDVERSGKKAKVVLDDEAKLRARAAIISEKLAAANGDLARTQDGAANQFRKAGGGLELFGRTLGEILLPAVNLGASTFNDFLGVVLDFAEQSRATLEAWVSYISAGVQTVGRVIRNHAEYWQIAKLKIGQWGAYVVDTLRLLPANFGIITGYLRDNWFNLLVDLGNLTRTFFTNLIDNAANAAQALWNALTGDQGADFVWKGLLDGFQATADQLPELMKPAWLDIGNDVDTLFRQIDEREAKLKKAAAPPAAKKLAEKAEKKADDFEHKLAQSAEINSKEAYSTIAKAAAGGDRGGGSGIKDVAKIGKDQLQVQREQLAEMKRRPQGMGQQLAVAGF